MSESLKSADKNLFLIDLDGEIITLPGKSLESMTGMFAHLESLALRREKKFRALPLVNSPSCRCGAPKYQPFESGEVERISFRELGRQVIRAAQGQIRVLQSRTLELQSLILINNWPVAEQLVGGIAARLQDAAL